MSKPKVLLKERSPIGTAVAVVEENDSTAYFYLKFANGDDKPLVRSCWLRNLKPANGAGEDGARMLPANRCSHPEGASPLDKSSLKVLWFEECNGAALLEGDYLLAVIPPAPTGRSSLPGYARDCTAPGENAMPLPNDPQLIGRIKKSKEFWLKVNEENFAESFSTPMVEALESKLGKHSKTYPSKAGSWPHRTIYRFDTKERSFLVSVGTCIIPQPESPPALRRVEFGLVIKHPLQEKKLKALIDFMNTVALQPWKKGMKLTGMTILGSENFPSLSVIKRKCPFVLLSKEHPYAPEVDLPEFHGDPVNLLWIHPVRTQF